VVISLQTTFMTAFTCCLSPAIEHEQTCCCSCTVPAFGR